MLQINGKDKYARVLIKKNFEIEGLAADYGEGECFVRGTPVYVDEQHPKSTCMVLNNKMKYARVLIRRKQL